MAPLWKHPKAVLHQISGLRAALSSGPPGTGAAPVNEPSPATKCGAKVSYPS